MDYLKYKRMMDCAVALIVLTIGSPILFVIACLIKLDSKGSVLFLQERIGEQGRKYKIYKFRTMVTGAEKMGTGLRSNQNDSRITKVGNVLRKTSLDELPQLINIIKGEMSLVGPRPTLEYQTKQYNEYQRQRLKVKPGVTGLAQVNGRQSLTWKEKIDFDVAYVKNLSFLLDMKIIGKTILVLFKTSDTHKAKNRAEDDQIS